MKDAGYLDEPPSYAESTQNAGWNQGAGIDDENNSFSSIVLSAFRNEIEPRIRPAPYFEPSSTILVLIPSATTPPPGSQSQAGSTTTSSTPKEKVVGFPSSEDPLLVHLRHPEDKLDFWRRSAASKELERLLHQHLKSHGYTFNETTIDPSKPTQPSVDWRSRTQRRLGEREASIHIELKNVCLRVENEMGLFESRNRLALIVRVDMGGNDRKPN